MKTTIRIEFDEKEYTTLSYALCGACNFMFTKIKKLEEDEEEYSLYRLYDLLNCIENKLSLLKKMPILPNTIEEFYEEINDDFNSIISTINKKDYRDYCIGNEFTTNI